MDRRELMALAGRFGAIAAVSPLARHCVPRWRRDRIRGVRRCSCACRSGPRTMKHRLRCWTASSRQSSASTSAAITRAARLPTLQAWSLARGRRGHHAGVAHRGGAAGTASDHHYRHAGVCRQRARLLRAAGRRHPVEEGRRRYRAVDRSAPGRRPRSRRRQEHRPFRAHGRRRSTARHHAAVRPPGADGEGHARRYGHRLRDERSAHSPDPRCATPGDCSGLGRRVFDEVAEPLAGVGDRIRQLLGGDGLSISGAGASARAPRSRRRTWCRSPGWS